jgi:hypothetical protein
LTTKRADGDPSIARAAPNFPMSLSSLIVQREIATIRQVEEALARQVLYGGDLVTNLLEVAKLDEGTLTLLLAESFGIQAATLGALPTPQDRARDLVSAELATERAIVPLAIEQGALVLAVAEPLPPEVEEELRYTLGFKIIQRIAPMVRVREALAQVYGAPIERRLQRLLARLGATEIQGLVPSEPAKRDTREMPVPERPHINTIPFQPRAGELKTPSVHAPRSTEMGFPAPPSRIPSASPPLAPVAPQPESLTHRTDPAPRPAHVFETFESPRASLIQREAATPPRPARRRRGPITPDAAKKELEEAQDRDAILDLFFDYSRQYFDYSALFVVHGDIAEGRDAYGDGASRERVTGIGVPLDLESVLARAREQRAPVQVTPSGGGLDPVLLADLQRRTTGEVLVVPVVVRTRVVALFYGDSGDSGVEPASVREVLPFALQIAKAFEKIIVRKKLQGFLASSGGGGGGGGGAQAAAKVDPDLVVPKAPVATKSPLAESIVPEAIPLPPAHRLSDPPPPPLTAAAVRKVSGPPIPREDPPEFAAYAEPTPTLPDEFDETDLLGAPPSSEAIAIAPRLPPSARAGSAPNLPSVIVDVDSEFGSMVDRVIDEGDDYAEAELLRQGQGAMPAIMARFPGPITADRTRVEEGALRVAECGPVLRLIAGQRKAALPFVLPLVGDGDAERRYWATLLLTELPYAEAVDALVNRLFDPEAGVRRVAHLAARAVTETAPEALVDRLTKVLRDPAAPSVRRVEVVRTLGDLRERLAVPTLLEAMADADEEVAAGARSALILVARQDFGRDMRRWQAWWHANATRQRIEWLIDALMHETQSMRRSAGEELKMLTKEYFGYYDDLPKRERERAQQRYRDWWTTEGRLRYRRG